MLPIFTVLIQSYMHWKFRIMKYNRLQNFGGMMNNLLTFMSLLQNKVNFILILSIRSFLE